MSDFTPANSDAIVRLLCNLLQLPAAAIARIGDKRVAFEAVRGIGAASFARAGSVFEITLQRHEIHVLDAAELNVGGATCAAFVAIAMHSDPFEQVWLCGFDQDRRRFTNDQLEAIQDLVRVAAPAQTEKDAATILNMLEGADAGVWAIDRDRTISYANSRFAQMVGRDRAEIIGRSLDSFHTPEAMAIATGYARTYLPARTYYSSQTDLISAQGRRLPVFISAIVARDEAAKFSGAFAIVSPVDRSKVVPTDGDQAKFETMVRHSPDVMFVFARSDDGNYELKYISAAADQFGWDLADLQSVFDVIHEEDREAALLELARVFDEVGEPQRMHTFRIVTKSGECHYLEARAIDLRGDPNVAGVVVNTRDVTERVLHSNRLAHLASHDSLTQLPNRGFLLDQLRSALARAIRRNQPVLVCYLDLDAFKAVNDRFGHAAGDAILVETADRLRQSVRGGDFAGRFGGDEFLTVCETLGDETTARDFVQRLQSALDAVYDTEFGQISCGVTIGHAISTPQDTAESLIARADADLYSRKQRGPS